jgi:hypothetical protein
LGLKSGLAARPGPTDWLSFVTAVAGGVYTTVAGERRVPDPSEFGLVLPVAVARGVVADNALVAECRFVARPTGRKMPEWGTDVVKYRRLEKD